MRRWLCLSLAACTGDNKDDGETGAQDADSHSDTDTDTDTDADTDVDTDTDTDTEPLEGCPVVWVPPPSDLVDCVGTVSDDYDDNGTVDSTYVEEYDSAGRLVSVTYDFGLTYEVTYDPVTGLMVEDRYSGAIESSTTYTYDAGGALVEAVATGDLASRTTYAPGPCGPVLIQVDLGDDGTLDLETVYSYTPTRSISEDDIDVDGVADLVSTNHHDPVLGRIDLLEMEHDSSHAGPEGTLTNTYDADGYNDTAQGWVWSPAGESVSTTSITHDDEGRIIEVYTETTFDSWRTTTTWECL